MRIIATCMASNEADVIEAFVRHNLRYLDAIVVLDHASIDGTPAILAQLVKEGLPIVALADRDKAFRQGQRQTQLARRYLREYDADFSFALDADEFIRCSSRAALEDSLRALPAGTFGLVHWQNYLPGPVPGREPELFRRIPLREAARALPERKVVLSRRFLEGDAWQVAIGNHFAITVAEGGAALGEHVELANVRLAHFPVRSVAQIEKKVILGWLAHRLSDPARRVKSTAPGVPTPAWHWGELFRELTNGKRLEAGSLHELALNFYAEELPPGGKRAALVADPLPVEFTLRYTPPVEMNSLAAAARWADSLVSDLLNAETSAVERNP